MISKSKAKLIRLLEHKKHRESEGLFVAEGGKIVNDLISSGCVPRTIIGTVEALASLVHTDSDIIEASADEIKKVSFLQHPQNILGIFETNVEDKVPTFREGCLWLALDGIQDPGNLGTIVRIADWFGIERIICSKDTADIYNPKVVQATMGSIARVGVTYTDLVPFLKGLPACTHIYGTMLDGDDIYGYPLKECGVIVMGNEGKGISPEVRDTLTDRLLIPTFHSDGNTAESLNVSTATAIICSEFRRRTR